MPNFLLAVVALLVVVPGPAAAAPSPPTPKPACAGWEKVSKLSGWIRVNGNTTPQHTLLKSTTFDPLVKTKTTVFGFGRATLELQPEPDPRRRVLHGTLTGTASVTSHTDYTAPGGEVITSQRAACQGTLSAERFSSLTVMLDLERCEVEVSALFPLDKCPPTRIQLPTGPMEVDMGGGGFNVTAASSPDIGQLRLVRSPLRAATVPLVLDLDEAYLLQDWPAGGLARVHVDLSGEEPVEVEVTGKHCSCNAADGRHELTARAMPRRAGGRFEKFLLEPHGKPPAVLANEGGDSPRLVLQGSAKETGSVTVTAVHAYRNNLFFSPPFEVEFLQVKKPEATVNAFQVGKEAYCFDASELGRVEVDAATEAWANGRSARDKVKWTFQPDQAGRFDQEENPRESRPSKRFVAAMQPDRNGEFGDHQIGVTVDTGTCTCGADPTKVTLFFERDARNNPDQLPNWAYFWKQTSAMPKGVTFEVVRQFPPEATLGGVPGLHCDTRPAVKPPTPGTLARYDYVNDRLMLLDKLLEGACMNRPGPAGTAGPVLDWGIDCFAVYLRHEGRHREQLVSWWGPRMARYSCLEDVDADLVPDRVEDAEPGCSRLSQKSCPGRPAWLDVTDIEMDAYQYGWSWTPGGADKEDWGCPGKQCPGKSDVPAGQRSRP